MEQLNEIPHSKYGYSSLEMCLMVIITGITNFVVIPAIIIIKKQHMIFQLYVSIFTMTTSFLYHTLESLDCQFFILSEGQWHRLDNIGAIVCFQMLFVSLADIRNLYYENLLNYFGLFITLLAQIKSPWDLRFTVYPIFLQIAICILIIIFRQRLPKLKMIQIYKGLITLIFAVYFFIKSQDEFQDYLRIHHGMWHFTISIFSFYIWQAKIDEVFYWTDFWKKPSIDNAYYKEN